jgi:predicted P-loop ATPase
MTTHYKETEKIISDNFANRLKLNKVTKDIYWDGEVFDLPKFRYQVSLQHNTVLDNDKYIHELAYIYASKNPFSPLEDYLDGCESKFPDRDYKDVFREINEKVLHIDPDSLEGVFLPKTLVGAVARVLKPGTKFEAVLLLKGSQGFYKTSFFRELAGEDLFTSMSLQAYNKDELMICHSKWIIELGECEETLTASKMGKLKAFITQQSDTLRKPYDSRPITLPRQFILVGTTNKDKFLVDATGNRRFWCVDVNEKIDIEWVKENRDLIWASAVKAYKDNYPIYLNETEQEMLNAVNKKYQANDMWEDIVTNWVEKRQEPFVLGDVLTQAIGKEPKSWTRKDEERISDILRGLGLEKPTKASRVNGKSGKYWQVPVAVTR